MDKIPLMGLTTGYSKTYWNVLCRWWILGV